MVFRVEFEVRDSELDADGIVNNANYFIYMEHTRHKFLSSIGIDYIAMCKQQQHLLLVESNIKFKHSLVSKDQFYVTCDITQAGYIKLKLQQEVRLINSDKLIAIGSNIAVCIDGVKNKMYIPEQIKAILNK